MNYTFSSSMLSCVFSSSWCSTTVVHFSNCFFIPETWAAALYVPLLHRSNLVPPYRRLPNVPVWTRRAAAVWHCLLGLPHCDAKTHLPQQIAAPHPFSELNSTAVSASGLTLSPVGLLFKKSVCVYPFKFPVPIFWGLFLEVELLGHMIISCLYFEATFFLS